MYFIHQPFIICKKVRNVLLLLLLLSFIPISHVMASETEEVPVSETSTEQSVPSAIRLNVSEITLSAGKSKQLKAKNSGNTEIIWKSSKPSIASVDSTGKVTAIKGGTAKITAKIGRQKLSCIVTVRQLQLQKSSLTLLTGGRFLLKYTKKNISGTLKWKSSSKSIVSVDQSGTVTAKKKGTATITLSADQCTAVCKVRVLEASLNKTRLTLRKDKTRTLRVIGTTKKATWKSSKPEVVSVDENGKITANKKGISRITASIGDSKLTCLVTVKTTRWEYLLDEYLEDPATNQLLFVQYTGGSQAQVILYNKVRQKWKKVLTCDGEVGKNGIDKEREGDKKTPTGTFNLTHAYGIQEDPGAKMEYVHVGSNLYWCGDSHYYNQLIDITEKPHYCTGEHLIDYTQCYAYGMFLDYNKDCVLGKGSAIFLHCKGNSGYTAGCIAVSRENMIKIIQTAQPGAKICIYPMG